MKKTTVALITLVLVLIIAGSSYEVYRLNVPSEAVTQKGTISVVDENGEIVNVPEPVNRIICLDSASTEIISALGCANRIVGRDAASTFPASVTDIPSLGEAYTTSVEQVLELKPDLVIGNAMLNYSAPVVNQLEAAGIPVFLSDSTNLSLIPNANETIIDTTCSLVTKLGLILNEQANASKIVNYMQSYNNLVSERITNLTTSEEPIVYFEWYSDWQTENVPYIAQAGGINIAANGSLYLSTLSPEYVTQANPDVIIDMISSSNHNITDFITARDKIMSRPALQDTNAVKEGNVYIIDGAIYNGGLNSIQGYLQWAKWLHPSLFEDVDPAAIQQQFLHEFFGNVTLEGVYAYP